MRISNLYLKNIGPFIEADMQFIDKNRGDDPLKPPIIIFTGINGAGKSIVIDAIRALFAGNYLSIRRVIVRNDKDFKIKSSISLNAGNTYMILETISKTSNPEILANNFNKISTYFNNSSGLSDENNNWIFDYWNSNISNEPYKIETISSINPQTYLHSSLLGEFRNINLINSISYFDYLKSGEDKNEIELGSYLMTKFGEIINSSILDGNFSHVSRTTLTPIVKIQDREIELSKLSAGNLYLISKLTSLLVKAYSVFLLKHSNVNSICDVPGLLLIDEIENHFHPEWQKKILNIIQTIFPNLQIILTTHSPFIVSSIHNSRVFACIPKGDHSEVVDATENYANKPIEEILTTPIFNTDSFNEEISMLLDRRKKALSENDDKSLKEIESRLKKINPQYFSYLDINDLIESIKNEKK